MSPPATNECSFWGSAVPCIHVSVVEFKKLIIGARRGTDRQGLCCGRGGPRGSSRARVRRRPRSRRACHHRRPHRTVPAPEQQRPVRFSKRSLLTATAHVHGPINDACLRHAALILHTASNPQNVIITQCKPRLLHVARPSINALKSSPEGGGILLVWQVGEHLPDLKAQP